MHRLSSTTIALALGLSVSVMAPDVATGQIMAGAHVTQMNDAFAGTIGVGARVGLDPPVVPIHVVGVAEYFFPDCGPAGDCSLKGASIEVNFELPLPVLAPYASVGLAWRELDPVSDEPTISESGVTVGLGTLLGLGSWAPFFEGRYEFIEAPEKQFMLRFGVLYRR